MAARGAEIQHQATSDWDPYDPAFRADPFPTYARFRRECPVGWCRRYGGFWVVSRYRDVFELARDSEAFCSARGVVIPPFPFEGRALPMEATRLAGAKMRTTRNPVSKDAVRRRNCNWKQVFRRQVERV